jgi:hypothetical protein
MTKQQIKKLAIKAGMPKGWYDGPWFDTNGKLQTGVPDCLVKFTELVIASSQ